MQPSQLIQDTARREWSRLFSWSSDHVPIPQARYATARAFTDLWPRATTSWRTAHGPFAFLLAATDSAMRLRANQRYGYVSPAAKLTCTVPTLAELTDVAWSYAWIGAAAANLQLPYSMHSMVLAAVNVHAVVDPTERFVKSRGYEPARGREAMARLLDVADHLAKDDEKQFLMVESVALREFERSRRWLAKLPAQRS